MNTRTAKTMIVIAAVAVSFVTMVGPPIPAQSENSNCKIVKGNLSVTFSPGAANGVVTNSGILNGTFATAFRSGSVVPTADPTSITFLGDSTLVSVGGILVTHDVYLFDFVRSIGPAMLRIDPVASTGIFVGATGVVYINPVAAGMETGEADLGGTICFAN